MGRIGKLFKRANEIAEGYQDARDQEFDDQFKTEFGKHFNSKLGLHTSLNEEDVQEFITKFDEDYPDEASWSWDEANNELDEVGDQQMELAKDREMEL